MTTAYDIAYGPRDHDRGDWEHEERRDKRLDEKGCEPCRHYRVTWVYEVDETHPIGHCELGLPLKPCSDYEREPGADG